MRVVAQSLEGTMTVETCCVEALQYARRSEQVTVVLRAGAV